VVGKAVVTVWMIYGRPNAGGINIVKQFYNEHVEAILFNSWAAATLEMVAHALPMTEAFARMARTWSSATLAVRIPRCRGGARPWKALCFLLRRSSLRPPRPHAAFLEDTTAEEKA
jgi:hypothetical protein